MATGKLSKGIIEEAAKYAAMGLDPLKFLYTTSSLERAIIRELYEEIKKTKEILDHNLAVNIATEVWKGVK